MGLCSSCERRILSCEGHPPSLPMARFRSVATTLALGVLLVGCDPAESLTSGAGAPSTQSFETSPEGQLDLRFRPLSWAPGDELVASAGPSWIRSTAAASGQHTVTWASGTGIASRVLGLLDGRVQASFAPQSPGGSAGATIEGPTSIHKRTVCYGNNCSTAIEFDYDFTEPGGNGVTSWTPPGAAAVTIDRLRVETVAQNDQDLISVTSPDPIEVIR